MKLFQVDAFTDRLFAGNPAGVCLLEAEVPDAWMQSMAAEMNLSETTFILPPQDLANTARVRIFNRTAEMPFAARATP